MSFGGGAHPEDPAFRMVPLNATAAHQGSFLADLHPSLPYEAQPSASLPLLSRSLEQPADVFRGQVFASLALIQMKAACTAFAVSTTMQGSNPSLSISGKLSNLFPLFASSCHHCAHLTVALKLPTAAPSAAAMCVRDAMHQHVALTDLGVLSAGLADSLFPACRAVLGCS